MTERTPSKDGYSIPDVHTAPDEPVPAILCLFTGDGQRSQTEDEHCLHAAREYAAAHGLKVIKEIGADRLRSLRRLLKQELRGRPALAIVFAGVCRGPDLARGMAFFLRPFVTRGLAVHCPELGLVTADSLSKWLPETKPRSTSSRESPAEVSGRTELGERYLGSSENDSPPTAARRSRRGVHSYPEPWLGYSETTSSGTPPPSQDSVPLRAGDGTLPHDGLFIRRNNAFGTRSNIGIRDLIEQGVLIEQAQIRFDDFIAADPRDLPVPGHGEAVAVSHGAATVAGASKAHAATTHFLEIALRASPSDPCDTRAQAWLPMNCVFVIDVSGSMEGEKLDTVKLAIRELYLQLRDTDILGIITFDTQARTLLKATPKEQLTLQQINGLLTGLQASGGTDINMGIQYGISEIGRYAEARTDLLNRLYLFSDGAPTSGETNWIKIRMNIAPQVRGGLKLSCFGFGSDARTRELDALAGLTGGYSTFVVHPEEVRLNLLADLDRRAQLAAINVQLQIEIEDDITIHHLYGHDQITDPAARAALEQDALRARRQARDELGAEALPDLIAQDRGIRIFAPDLALGETYWIVFELEVPIGRPIPRLGSAVVQYVDALARASRRHDIALSEQGTIPAATVFVHGVGLWTSEVTFYALDDLYQGDREMAKARLENQARALQAAHSFVAAEPFRNDQVLLRKLISLADNLGKTVSWSEDISHGAAAYTVHAMSAFGQVRSGFSRARPRSG